MPDDHHSDPQRSNPLLSTEFVVPFDRIDASHVVPGLRRALARADERLQQIKAAAERDDLTYDDSVGALDALQEELARPFTLARHLTSVVNTPELRAAFNEVQPEVVSFFARLSSDQRVWSVLKRFADSDAGRALGGVARRNLDITLAEFRRSGADLPEAERKEVERLKVELARLSTRFAENVLDATNAFELVIEDEERLAGLPASAKRRARAAAEAKGQEGFRFTLQAPSYLPFIKYVDDRELRRTMYEAFLSIGGSEPHDNRDLIRAILRARREAANVLGFQDFADYQTELRMIGSGANAAAFAAELAEKTRPHFDREVAELERFAATELGLADLQPWDVAYASEKLRMARYDVDEEALRPYFPLPRVVEGLFDLTQRLFGVRVEPVSGVPTWHPQVEVFHLHHEDGTFLGSVYADWYPRESKRDGAWMNGLVTGGPTESGFEPHVGIIACNFTAPEEGAPALLTHSEVETVFHEWGHLLHHLVSRVPIKARSSMSVPWDFVELPSQIMENWTWEKQALDLFARHFETGETLPDELFQRLKRSRTFHGAIGQMRQLSFGTVDLALHRDFDPASEEDPLEFARQVLAPLDVRPEFARGERLTRFTHIFSGGYAAGYYSYKWSEVLDADAFGRFKAEGIFNPDTGRDFVAKILSKGDSEDAAKLFRDFMGRDPDVDALIRRNLGVEAGGVAADGLPADEAR